MEMYPYSRIYSAIKIDTLDLRISTDKVLAEHTVNQGSLAPHMVPSPLNLKS